MADTAKLSDGSNLMLPASLVASENWRPGQEFVLLPSAAGLILTPVPSVDELEGIASGAA